MDERARKAKENKTVASLVPSPVLRDMEEYERLEGRRVIAGLKYWVRHGSRYWDEKAKKAKPRSEARYRAKMMRRVGAAFVLSARFYLNALGNDVELGKQIDATSEVVRDIVGQLEARGFIQPPKTRARMA